MYLRIQLTAIIKISFYMIFFFRVVKKQEKAKKFSVIELRSPGLGVDISMHVIAACDRYLMRR